MSFDYWLSELCDENDELILENFTPRFFHNLNKSLCTIMTDYGFYTEQEIKELADSDLSFEIADAALLKTPEADEYMHLLIQELKRRND
jgi:transposase